MKACFRNLRLYFILFLYCTTIGKTIRLSNSNFKGNGVAFESKNIVKRGLHARMRFLKSYLRGRDKHAISIQNVWRSYSSKRQCDLLRTEKLIIRKMKSALKIQTFYRRWHQRRFYRSYLSILKQALNVIICNIRRFIVMRQFKDEKSAKTIQTAFRKFVKERNEFCEEYTHEYLIDLMKKKRSHKILRKAFCQHFARRLEEKIKLLCTSSTEDIIETVELHETSDESVSKGHAKIIIEKDDVTKTKQSFTSKSCGFKSTVTNEAKNIEAERNVPMGRRINPTKSVNSSSASKLLRKYINEKSNQIIRLEKNICGPWYNKTVLRKIQGVVSSHSCFNDLDPFNIGVVRRHDFMETLKKKWQEIGCKLHAEELRLITNTFQPHRDGYVNYKKYTNFAKAHERPCEIHGRIVCTQCTIRGPSKGQQKTKCQKFVPTSQSCTSLCSTCRLHIDAHVLIPRPNMKKTQILGMPMSSTEMKRIFQLKRFPSRSISSELKVKGTSFSCSTSQPFKESKDAISKKKRFSKKSSREKQCRPVVSKHTKKMEGDPIKTIKKITKTEANCLSLSRIHGDDAISQHFTEELRNLIEKMETPLKNNLSLMCPINICCKKFPSNIKLKKHLIYNHSKDEIISTLEANKIKV